MAKALDKSKPTSRKQKKFVKKFIETGNLAKSAELAGYDSQYGSYLKRQPKIQNEIQLALERAGLTDDTLALKMKEGQNATYVKKDGGTKYKDFHAIHKYLDMQVKIGGGYAPEKHEIKQEKLILNITLDTIKGLKDARGQVGNVVNGEVLEAEDRIEK